MSKNMQFGAVADMYSMAKNLYI